VHFIESCIISNTVLHKECTCKSEMFGCGNFSIVSTDLRHCPRESVCICSYPHPHTF